MHLKIHFLVYLIIVLQRQKKIINLLIILNESYQHLICRKKKQIIDFLVCGFNYFIIFITYIIKNNNIILFVASIKTRSNKSKNYNL